MVKRTRTETEIMPALQAALLRERLELEGKDAHLLHVDPAYPDVALRARVVVYS